MPPALDLTSCVFDRLTVVGRSHVDRCGKVQWLCSCKCGKEICVVGSQLKSGHTKSCGCFTRDRVTKHGKSKTSEYRIRLAIIQRCCNPKYVSYPYYGGRGITVCSEWLQSFEAFHSDMGDRPSKDHSIDRIDNDGPYCKENCRWATHREQLLNTSRTTQIAYDGLLLSVTEWAEKYSVDRGVLYSRLERGWSIEEALNRPIQKRGQR